MIYAEPERIYLYGAQVNGDAKENSDIDIAYEDPVFNEHYKIKDEVEKLETLIHIDVTNISKCEKRFQNRVKSTGKVLFSATKKLRAEDGLYNFSQALERFVHAVNSREALKNDGYDDLFLDLIVKRFEFTFEMGWKAVKRYLDYLGFEEKSPRGSIKEAFAQNIIENEQVWLDLIEQRNLTSHVYDEYQITEIVKQAVLKRLENEKCRVFLFGSRAKGVYRFGSDFDIWNILKN